MMSHETSGREHRFPASSIQPRRNGKGPLGTGALFALIVATSLAGCAQKKQKPVEDKVPVRVATAEQKTIPVQILAIGNVQPMSTVAVRALVAGQLLSVSFREGDEVRRGAVLFSIDPRPYQSALLQAQANLARDEAQLRNARSEAERYGELVKKDYVTREEYEKFASGAEAASAVVAADRANVENARLQLSYCEIRSPVDGKTGSLQVHPGNLVKANDTTALVTINQVAPVLVTFAVPETTLAAIRAKGTDVVPVSVKTKEGGGGNATGRLNFVDNSVDEKTGTITLKAVFPNTDRKLWPGQYVDVALTLETRENAIVVPTQAVQTGQTGQFVYVVKADRGVELRPVVVFRAVGQESIIDKGVAPGETVVTDGQLRLTPKSKVDIKQPV
jgi:multidrug efflux system membrane fusion protein